MGDAALHFQYHDLRRVTVTVSPSPNSEPTPTQTYESAHGTAQTEIDPSDRILGRFEDLAQLRLPTGSKPTGLTSYLEADGSIKAKHVVPLGDLPQPMQSFVDQLRNELRDYLVRTVNVLRWRHGETGPPNPFGYVREDWSFDGESWHLTPGSLHSKGSRK
jgi:hypothetical protein